MIGKRDIIWLVSLLTGGYTLLVVFFYWLQFGFGLPAEQADWGAFGDYIGGMLGSWFSLLNVIAFIYLTFVIQGEQERVEQNKLKEIKEKEKRTKLESFLRIALEEMVQLQQDFISYRVGKKGKEETFIQAGRLANYYAKHGFYLQVVGCLTNKTINIYDRMMSQEWSVMTNDDKDKVIIELLIDIASQVSVIQKFLLEH